MNIVQYNGSMYKLIVLVITVFLPAATKFAKVKTFTLSLFKPTLYFKFQGIQKCTR